MITAYDRLIRKKRERKKKRKEKSFWKIWCVGKIFWHFQDRLFQIFFCSICNHTKSNLIKLSNYMINTPEKVIIDNLDKQTSSSFYRTCCNSKFQHNWSNQISLRRKANSAKQIISAKQITGKRLNENWDFESSNTR